MELPIFKSPGVFVKEVDIDIYPRFSKKYLRKVKICKIFDLDVPKPILTFPKGQNNFTQTKFW